MVDLDILKEKNCSKETLKAAFTATEKSKDITRLLQLLSSRLSDGQQQNIANYRIYQALDTAWNVPLKQINATMLQSLIDSNMTSDQMQDTLKTWGVDLSEVLTEYVDPKTNKTLKKVNLPAFYRVFVPLCRSYVSIRRAKTMNDRRLVPFMKYEPAISNELTRMRCEVITSRVEEISTEYGYWSVEDQAFWRVLHYGVCLRFPVEEWHVEEQLVEKDSEYVGEPDHADTDENDPDKLKIESDEKKYKLVRMREGLRYHMPHPTRMFYDSAWPLHTFNTDSGASYAGYWRVMRYGEIANKKSFFNLDCIKVGNSSEWFNNNQGFFKNVYPCTLRFPTMANDGVGFNDTEKKLSDYSYQTVDYEKALILTEQFAKLIPSEWGLGDYNYPVWFRFVMANSETVVYAAPLPYAPVLEDDYDGISGQSINPSMSLEILPFQDQFANLLSQYLLSVKQNLANMTLVDQDVVEEEDISRLEKFTQSIWSSLNFVRFSSRRFFKSQQQPMALFPQKFPQVDTGSIAVAMRTLLEILERVLVISAQESGQTATHEQTREEVRNIATNTSTRATFTASTLDRSRHAWKRQIYDGLMAYGSEEGYAQVPAHPRITPDLVSKLGFTMEDEPDSQTKKVTVRWTKTAIKFASFAANRDGDDRINDIEIARSLSAFMQQLGSNQMIAQAIGPDQFIALANIIGRTAGLPREFRLINRGPDVTPEEQTNQVMQAVQQMLAQLEQKMGQEVQGALQAVVKQNDSEIAQLMQAIEEISSTLGIAPPQQAPQDLPAGAEQLPPEAALPPGV